MIEENKNFKKKECELESIVKELCDEIKNLKSLLKDVEDKFGIIEEDIDVKEEEIVSNLKE